MAIPLALVNSPVEQTRSELALIPRGDAAQNEFRMIFNARRLNSLSAHPEGQTDIRSVIEESAASVSATRPGFEPVYDPKLLSG
jgi:hypothetical protein